MALDTTYCVDFDQCQVGLCLPGKPDKKIRKRTTLMTNSRHVVDLFSCLQCTCRAKHAHVQGTCNGIQVSKHCQIYTPTFCRYLAEAAVRHGQDAGLMNLR